MREVSDLRCSFCNESEHDVRKLIAGPNVFICDECIRTCIDILADDEQADARADGDDEAGKRREESRVLGSACAICGLPLLKDEALPIKERGFLCRGCVDAVEAAIAEARLRE